MLIFMLCRTTKCNAFSNDQNVKRLRQWGYFPAVSHMIKVLISQFLQRTLNLRDMLTLEAQIPLQFSPQQETLKCDKTNTKLQRKPKTSKDRKSLLMIFCKKEHRPTCLLKLSPSENDRKQSSEWTSSNKPEHLSWSLVQTEMCQRLHRSFIFLNYCFLFILFAFTCQFFITKCFICKKQWEY